MYSNYCGKKTSLMASSSVALLWFTIVQKDLAIAQERVDCQRGLSEARSISVVKDEDTYECTDVSKVSVTSLTSLSFLQSVYCHLNSSHICLRAYKDPVV